MEISVDPETTRQPPPDAFHIRPAAATDVPVILALIRELAEYEKLLHEVVATEALVKTALFGPEPVAQCALACVHSDPVGFALYFHNYSTFKGRAGLYLEDLFVRPEHRGHGIGEALLRYLARSRGGARLSAHGVGRPQLEQARDRVLHERVGAVGVLDWTVFRVSGEALARLGS